MRTVRVSVRVRVSNLAILGVAAPAACGGAGLGRGACLEVRTGGCLTEIS